MCGRRTDVIWGGEGSGVMEWKLALLVENLIPEAVRLRSLNCGKRRHTTRATLGVVR